MKGLFCTLSTCLFLAACSLPNSNKFSDPEIIRIYSFADERKGDSLAVYLTHANTILRAEACLAFGSVQDSAFSYALGNVLLEDPDVQTRANAAFALGQIKSNASVNALIPALSDSSSLVVAEVLEAMGKTITSRDLPVFKSFTPTDSVQEHGYASGLYRLGLRGLSDSSLIEKSQRFLNKKYSDKIRITAAHVFARGTIAGEFFLGDLIQAAQTDPNPFVRMAATAGLQKVVNNQAQSALVNILEKDADYRVRVSAVRSLQKFPAALQSIIGALRDQNVNVSIAASEGIRQLAKKEDLDQLKEQIKTIDNGRVRANLIDALVQHDTSYLNMAIAQFNKTQDDYEKAWLCSSIGKSANGFAFLGQQVIQSKALVVKTSAAQALTTLNSLAVEKNWPLPFAEAYKNAILDGDAGVIGIVAGALTNPAFNYKKTITDFSFLAEAKKKLSLPKDIEALQPLDEALAYFEGKPKPPVPTNPYNHPIPWNTIKKIDRNQTVSVQTTKGDVVLQLLVEESPGSVVNFIDLAQKGYFNGRFVHRVVPNFVIQTGCYRGDGFGSEDYSIRSEFSRRRYTEGSVGMASAGKDTEGTQWFITHSPTPHLDGRYTIFAIVKEGMDVVHQIEVGDKILTVTMQ